MKNFSTISKYKSKKTKYNITFTIEFIKKLK